MARFSCREANKALSRCRVYWAAPPGPAQLSTRLPGLSRSPGQSPKEIHHTGAQNFGGSIVTAGGLVFIGSTTDEKFRAFDKSSGELLWETQLPAAGFAAPCTYSVNDRQYVVIAAGGGGKSNTRISDTYIAFALPVRR